VARCPYIYLSAGVGIDEFVASLNLAAAAGRALLGRALRARHLAGRPSQYMPARGRAALDRWLATDGVRNVERIAECLKEATPWHRR